MLVKNIFRKEIKEILLEHMVNGKITPGVRISLPQIAKELEVSVTPIREALTQLSEIGIVNYIPNRGFFVTEFSENEAVELFETIALLESEAIKKSEFTKQQLEELNSINERFKTSNHSLHKLQMDMKFHQKLIENYPNTFLKKIIEDIRIRIFIYEHQFMSHQPINSSAKMHADMIDALKNGNSKQAIQLLHKNWMITIDTIIKTYNSKAP
ncbi:GntR family transcriptional regulator [Psychroserpens sp. SPM9]|uniref:GntR family transcriptional regulator n=1 Tax=Psychroserpens sp. SPM9 TaxID=2975598 RepID=UPI0021A51830|nr:GntR family transcriptional regulator [Psychroserpens sp. SPM9]MDG5491500.1 GntR family transcriptional regulator [Psychroserpens sp. SPM9]